MFRKILKNQQGTTLMELLVAVSIFAVIILSATQIFQFVIEGQRNAVASQNLQENLRYIFEVMSREIRSAKSYDGGKNCGIAPTNKIYNTNINALYFENKDEDCVVYKLEDGRLNVKRGDFSEIPITPNEIIIDKLLFDIVDNAINESSITQPSVRITITARAVGKKMHEQITKIQTTITSRVY